MKRSRLPAKSKRARAVRSDLELAHYRGELQKRCKGFCENPRCGNRSDDAHHTSKPRRARHALIVALCRQCHNAIDAPYGPRKLFFEFLWYAGEYMVFDVSMPTAEPNGWLERIRLARLAPYQP